PETYIQKALELNLPIYKTYGMTEMASQVCTSKRLQNSDEIFYSGYLLNYRELKIVDKQIFVHGPCLFKGYLKNNQLVLATEIDGWFCTREYGEIHRGQIQVLGRSYRIFQSAGENISPEFIEQELLKTPGISKAYVHPEPDSKYGMRPIAYIERESALTD